VNIRGILLAIALAFILTLFTTSDIADHQIEVDGTALVLRFGLTAILSYLAISILGRLRTGDHQKPTLD
jgi:hypothetical protein